MLCVAGVFIMIVVLIVAVVVDDAVSAVVIAISWCILFRTFVIFHFRQLNNMELDKNMLHLQPIDLKSELTSGSNTFRKLVSIQQLRWK